MRSVWHNLTALWRDRRGITGLETAIVLIAFVIVSATFAFAVLSTGLFSSDKAKETMNAGLKEAQGTMALVGSVLAEATVTSVTNEAVGTGNGTATQFTLAHKPVVRGSLTVRVAGNRKSEGSDYTVNYDTGTITFTTAPASGQAITADYTWYSVDTIKFQVSNSAGGQPVDLTPGNTVIVYQDADTLNMNYTGFTVTKLGNADADNMLEAGEVFEISVNVGPTGIDAGLTDDEEFTILVKPSQGAVLQVTRTIPAGIQPKMNLH